MYVWYMYLQSVYLTCFVSTFEGITKFVLLVRGTYLLSVLVDMRMLCSQAQE